MSHCLNSYLDRSASIISNFTSDSIEVFKNYFRNSNVRLDALENDALNLRKAALTLRIIGIAALALGVIAASSAVVATISSAPISALVYTGFAAGLLAFGHDFLIVGDNLTQPLNPSLANLSRLMARRLNADTCGTCQNFQGIFIENRKFKEFIGNIIRPFIT